MLVRFSLGYSPIVFVLVNDVENSFGGTCSYFVWEILNFYDLVWLLWWTFVIGNDLVLMTLVARLHACLLGTHHYSLLEKSWECGYFVVVVPTSSLNLDIVHFLGLSLFLISGFVMDFFSCLGSLPYQWAFNHIRLMGFALSNLSIIFKLLELFGLWERFLCSIWVGYGCLCPDNILSEFFTLYGWMN